MYPVSQHWIRIPNTDPDPGEPNQSWPMRIRFRNTALKTDVLVNVPIVSRVITNKQRSLENP
jgi:hypothetical protein